MFAQSAVGSYVARHLLTCAHKVTIMDDLFTGKRENVPQVPLFYERDICTGCFEEFEEFRIEALYHQAAQMDMRCSVEEPNLDADIIVLGRCGCSCTASKTTLVASLPLENTLST